MFVEERLEEILNILKTNGKVNVNDLSKRYFVSKDLIRKDLQKLEQKGLVQRTYGGAILKRQENKEYIMEDRLTKNLEIKEKIAQKIYEIIEDDETIFLDASSINYLVAEKILIGNKKITLITNMVKILNLFNCKNNAFVKVVGVGGILNQSNGSFMGSISICQIKNFKFSKSFVGVAGINIIDEQITTFDIDDGITKKAMLESSRENYIICESNKFYTDGIYIFDSLKNIKGIITEDFEDMLLKNKIHQMNLKLIMA